nr:hypothetical protein Itr_chr13CG08110 [Ipomoea trifida]
MARLYTTLHKACIGRVQIGLEDDLRTPSF